MEQSCIQKIFANYDHLKGKYLGCFCKDQMDNLLKSIQINMNQDPNPCIFVLINTWNLASNSEHWMGIVMNKSTNCSGYFDSFSRTFDWLENTLHKHFNEVYCLTACLYAKCCDLIGWILELGPSIHFRIDDPDHLYSF